MKNNNSNNSNDVYDCAIIGGGHAGLEAAWAVSQFGLRVLLLSLPEVGLGSTPCNPAIGGVGKAQVVREIDALGGLMGKIADMAGIQFRVLNESKGHAVQSTRIQVDKNIYSNLATEIIAQRKNVDLELCQVEEICALEGDHAVARFSLKTDKGEFKALSVVLTTGTFLGGKTHVGKEQKSEGRVRARASKSLGDILNGLSVKALRFKTGTPPRLLGSSLDFSKMEVQPSDPEAHCFHYKHKKEERFLEQSHCYLTRIPEASLGIIRSKKDDSPLFNGQIEGVGPRYCPSIEDKAFRYPDRNSHHVFVEPEGISAQTYYPNGLSTSLPKEVQEDFLQQIPGMESVVISEYGYAVEYDVIDTTELNHGLELKKFPYLFFAGQVNGTSGYEEAAAQGLIAGLNVALKIQGKESFKLSRVDSYIGVLIEDLISYERDEPYRLFTARSEYRLFIREDNTVERICPYRTTLNLNQEVDVYQRQYKEELELLEELCEQFSFSGELAKKLGLPELSVGPASMKFKEYLRRPDLDPVKALEVVLWDHQLIFDSRVVRNAAINIKYEGYVERSKLEHNRLKKLGEMKIPWEELALSGNISFECRLRIQRIRPQTFSELQNIKGIRPATLAYVAGRIY